MANDIRVDVRTEEMVKAVTRFTAKGASAASVATARALNKTMTTARAQSARDLKKVYGALKIGVIKRRIKLLRASRSRQESTLLFNGGRFRLFGNWPISKTVTRTGVRTRLRGVSSSGRITTRGLPYGIEMGSGLKVDPAELRNAFIQRSRKTQTPHVWMRLARPRYPIDVLLVPGLGRAVVEKNILTSIERAAVSRYPTVLARELEYALRAA